MNVRWWAALAGLVAFLLVGVGAVGSALLHALYPLRLLGVIMIADNDPKGIEKTNLSRYPLFGWASRDKMKASEAADLLRGATFQVLPHDGSFEHFFTGKDKPQIVLSAVDKNAARHALQEQYAPLILSASTHNLRAELLRCGPPPSGACLACFNPLEREGRTEEEIRASSLQFVRKLSGFTKPSKANELAFNRAVEQVAQAARELLDSLVTTAPPRDREVEAAKARARAAEAWPARSPESSDVS